MVANKEFLYYVFHVAPHSPNTTNAFMRCREITLVFKTCM